MTREHVVPAFIYQFQKGIEPLIVGWNEVAERMTPGEFKVKDVCASCNSGTLSALDSYGKSMLTESGILTANYTKVTVALPYKYDLLARWLLKISFNSSRTDGAHRHLFEGFIPYILGNAETVQRPKMSLVAYLAGPKILDEQERVREPFVRHADSSNRFNPFLMRISYGGVPGANNYNLRLVIFGPLVFFMLIFHPGVLPGHAAVAVRHFLKVMPGATELKADRKFAEINAGQKTWLDLYAYQVNRVHALAG